MKTILIILFATTLNGQNLVQNPSFEDYTSCPNSSEQINRANHWDRPPNTFGTPDYFNVCGTQSVEVPNNSFGSQQPFEGNAYAGIVVYYDFSVNQNWREYIQTELSSPLVAGQTYYLSFYVSLGDDIRLASNNIGAIFTTNQLSGNGDALPINVTPNILEQNVITNTTDWTQITGTYLAAGDERYLTIGNFFYNEDTQSQISDPVWGFPQAYYYIDNVSVSTTLGQNDFNIKKVKITPNPVVETFYISLADSEPIRDIILYSQYNIIKHFDTVEKVFDIRDLPTGIYYLSVTFESGQKIISKVIKE